MDQPKSRLLFEEYRRAVATRKATHKAWKEFQVKEAEIQAAFKSSEAREKNIFDTMTTACLEESP